MDPGRIQGAHGTFSHDTKTEFAKIMKIEVYSLTEDEIERRGGRDELLIMIDGVTVFNVFDGESGTTETEQ